MRYLVLLYGDETTMPEPGTPEFDADLEAYAAFDELAGDAVVGGEALLDNASCRTLRGMGDGDLRITAGPYAESVEGVGGVYVLEAATLDDAIELARHIPAAKDGGVEIRPMVQWEDRRDQVGPAPAGAGRWFATIHGPETEADDPTDEAWAAGAEAHGRFAEEAGDVITAAGAVHPTHTATTVRVRGGELRVTDGPYAEAMEVVGGVYVLRGTDEEVDRVAASIPVNPGVPSSSVR